MVTLLKFSKASVTRRMTLGKPLGTPYGNQKPHQRNDKKRAYLPYIQGVTYRVSKILRKKEILTAFKPLETIKQKMRIVKDKIDEH